MWLALKLKKTLSLCLLLTGRILNAFGDKNRHKPLVFTLYQKNYAILDDINEAISVTNHEIQLKSDIN